MYTLVPRFLLLPSTISALRCAHLRPQLQSLWDILSIGEPSTDESVETRVYDLIPPNPVFSHYLGSLTTPPCTEVRNLFHNPGWGERTIHPTVAIV